MERTKPVPRLAQLREQAGLTQLEVSQLLGVTENTVANWEKGRSGIEWIERIVKVCKLFDCSAEDLIEYVVETQPAEPNAKRPTLEDLRRMLNTHKPAQTANPETKGEFEKQEVYE
ncbi:MULTISPECIES: helix-turn-helix transcriptional regulator [unclassified Microcoleus]|uniref:helix-turn-helix transcriptional regulator n=1 Tax=unclassified Microcoleus TaxID=2642155 RepID=UPI002FD1CFCC